MSTRHLNSESDFEMLERMVRKDGWVIRINPTPIPSTIVVSEPDGPDKLWLGDGGAFRKRLFDLGHSQAGGLREIRLTTR